MAAAPVAGVVVHATLGLASDRFPFPTLPCRVPVQLQRVLVERFRLGVLSVLHSTIGLLRQLFHSPNLCLVVLGQEVSVLGCPDQRLCVGDSS